jgi:DNA-binding CsgD family transcriptional regulator
MYKYQEEYAGGVQAVNGCLTVLEEPSLTQSGWRSVDEFAAQFAYGCVVLDAFRDVVASNPDGKKLYASCHAADVVSHNKCYSFSLESAIRGAFAGRRSFCEVNVSDRRAIVAALPLGELANEGGVRHVVLVFERSPACEPVALTLFAKICGLTASEQRVLAALSEGLTVPEVSERCGVAESTVRTHIRHLFEKTGANNLRALVSRMAHLPPVAAMNLMASA